MLLRNRHHFSQKYLIFFKTFTNPLFFFKKEMLTFGVSRLSTWGWSHHPHWILGVALAIPNSYQGWLQSPPFSSWWLQPLLMPIKGEPSQKSIGDDHTTPGAPSMVLLGWCWDRTRTFSLGTANFFFNKK